MLISDSIVLVRDAHYGVGRAIFNSTVMCFACLTTVGRDTFRLCGRMNEWTSKSSTITVLFCFPGTSMEMYSYLYSSDHKHNMACASGMHNMCFKI